MKEVIFVLNGKKFKLFKKGKHECIGCYFYHQPMKDGCSKTPMACLEKPFYIYVEDDSE